MITFADSADRYDRKELNVDQTLNDDSDSRFIMKILSSDFPPQFENNSNRKVTLSVVDGVDFPNGDDVNSILIPLVLTGVSHINGKTKSYYRQKYDSQNLQLSSMIQLDGFSIRDSDNAGDIRDPHLLVVLEVEAQQEQDTSNLGSQQQQFSGGLNADMSIDRRPHVEKMENSNAGLDLAVGDRKSDLAEQDREQESRARVREVTEI